MDAALPFVLGALKALVLLAAGALASLALRGRPARLRAVVWGTALSGCLLIPVISPLLPPLPVPLPEVLGPPSRGPLPVLRSDLSTPVASTSPASAAAMPSGNRADAAPALREVPIRQRLLRSVPWRHLAPFLWAAGTALLAARLGRGLLRVARIVRAAEPVADPGWQRALAHARASVGCNRRVRLLTSPEIEVPATVGFVRPTVVLPLRAATWLDDRRRAVLQHECIHIARGDWPLRIVARAARAAYWFNPLAWWATRRLELEQELACDEEVLALGTGASDYACHLLGIARHALACPNPAIPALGMARRTHLEERIMTLLKRSTHRRVGIISLIPAALLVASLVPALAAVVPGEASHETAPPAAPAAAPAPASAPSPPPAPAITGHPGPKPAPAPSAAPAPEPPAAPAPRAASPEIAALVAELEAAEARLAPQIAAIEAVQVDLEPELAAIAEAAAAIDDERIAEIESQLEPYLARIRDIQVDMKPYEDQIEALQKELQSLELHIDDGTLEEVQRQIHEQIEAHMTKVESIHVDMEPFLEQMAEVHEQMAKLQAELAAAHIDMEPIHAEMARTHTELERKAREFERQQRLMERDQREIERLGDRLERAIRGEVASYLRSQLGAVVAPDAPFDEAAARIAADANINLSDGNLRIDAPRSEVETILGDLLGPRRVGTEKNLQAAIESAAAGLSPLVIQVR